MFLKQSIFTSTLVGMFRHHIAIFYYTLLGLGSLMRVQYRPAHKVNIDNYIRFNGIDLELPYTPLPPPPQGDFARVYFSESLYKMLQNEPC